MLVGPLTGASRRMISGPIPSKSIPRWLTPPAGTTIGWAGVRNFEADRTSADSFAGMDLASPGIQPTSEWRSDLPPEERAPAADTACYGAVARIS
jgi:hypothetical protein